jgi:hypothetical protein
MAASEIRCVYFRVTDGKLARDLGRNLEEIEAVMDDFEGAVMHSDPHDSSTFLLTLPQNVKENEVNGLVTRLSNLTDKKHGDLLLEAWPSTVSEQNLSRSLYTSRSRYNFEI